MIKHPSLGQLNRPVKICSAKDVIVKGELRFARQGIRDTWAKFDIVRPSSFGQQGQNLETQPTHRATMRAMVDLDLTTAAWLYESRSLTPDLWYKVVGYREENALWQLDLRLYNREEASPEDPRDMGLVRHNSGVPL